MTIYSKSTQKSTNLEILYRRSSAILSSSTKFRPPLHHLPALPPSSPDKREDHSYSFTGQLQVKKYSFILKHILDLAETKSFLIQKKNRKFINNKSLSDVHCLAC